MTRDTRKLRKALVVGVAAVAGWYIIDGGLKPELQKLLKVR